MPVSWYILNPVKVVSGCYHPILKEDCYRRVFTEEGIGGVGMLDLSRRYPNSPRPHLGRMHHAVTMMLTLDDVGADEEDDSKYFACCIFAPFHPKVNSIQFNSTTLFVSVQIEQNGDIHFRAKKKVLHSRRRGAGNGLCAQELEANRSILGG